MAAAFLAVDQMGFRTVAPMDSVEFGNHLSLRHVGLFGVAKGDGPEVQKFLHEEVGKHPETCVWVTPQGVFAPNELPQPNFRSGLSRWSNFEGATRIPVVIHYYQGVDRKAGLFFRMGEPVPTGNHSPAQDSELLRQALSLETEKLLQSVWRAHSGQRFDHSRFIMM